MTEAMKWTLKVITKKGGTTYQVSNGKGVFNVPQSAICFREEDATDGCEANVVTKSGQPVKVTIPGKAEVQPRPAAPPAAQSGFRGRPSDRGDRGGPPPHQGRPAGGGPRREPDNPPRRDATAPYNFVTAESPLAFTDDANEPRFSGTIACVGEALTPLLVAAAHDRGAAEPGTVPERRFFTVDCKPVIPGSSLKGMIRSAVEALSRAPMKGLVSDTTIGTRSVSEPESGYSKRFKTAIAENRLRAGFLEKRGADCLITPCEYVRVRLLDLDLNVGRASPARQIAEQAQRRSRDLRVRFTIGPDADQDQIPIAAEPRFADARPLPPGMLEGRLVPTGGMPTQRGGTKDKAYIFFMKAKPEPQITVNDDVVQAFEDQRTESQKGLLAFYGGNSLKVPVFYLVEDGEVVAYGLCKYFRVMTRHSPAELASRLPDDAPERAMSDLLFGSVGLIPRRGRVRCSIGAFRDRPVTQRFPPQGGIVAGNPAASAITMYLVQDDDRTTRRGRRNRFLVTYDDDKPVLRGRKLYWHRRATYAPPPPNDNANVQAVYHPLAPGCTFTFTASFERLTRAQLGALCEAIDFPIGHAHKLGLGKPFGLGSVRVTVDWSRTHIAADREHYASLSRRLRSLATRHPAEATIAGETAGNAREAFQNAVVASDRASGRFEDLAHVRQFRALTSWDKPPGPQAIAYMPLSDRDSPSATYADRPILDTPGGVRRHDSR